MKSIVLALTVLAMAASAFAAPITNIGLLDYTGRLGASWDWEKSLDGDAGTFWHCSLGGTDIPFITYQFDQVYEIGEVTVTAATGYHRKMATAGILVSTDGVNFTPAGNYDVSVTDGAVTTFDLGGVDAMYVRVEGAQAYYGNWNPKYATYPDTTVDRYGISFADIVFNAVPEPATATLLTIGAAAIFGRRKRS